MSSANKGRRRVTFRMAAPDARQVGVAGSFNDWNPDKHLLKKKPGGFWEKTVMLAPGRYEYKYVVDGRWCLDPSNSSTCDNGFGTGNSVVEVNAAKRSAATDLRTLPTVRRPAAEFDVSAAPINR